VTPHLIALDGVSPRPWRNGGGTTRELLVRPEAGDWRLRISVAEIEADGPFSTFPGVARWFAVLEGGGVVLTIDGVEHVCRAGDAPLSFSGDAQVACRLLEGPSRDLNLMLRGIPGGMQPVVAGEAWVPPVRGCGLYARIAGRCRADDATTDVPADHLAWFDAAPRALTFDPQGAAPGAVAGWWLTADSPKDDA
jgi:environmental stress-induced protein Ves